MSIPRGATVPRTPHSIAQNLSTFTSQASEVSLPPLLLQLLPVDLLADVFCRHDPLAHAARVTRAEFAGIALGLLPRAAKYGLTIVACMPATGEIVGVMLTNDGAADSAAELSESNQKFRPIACILGKLDEIYLASRKPRPARYFIYISSGFPIALRGTGLASNLCFVRLNMERPRATKSHFPNRLTGDRNTSSRS